MTTQEIRKLEQKLAKKVGERSIHSSDIRLVKPSFDSKKFDKLASEVRETFNDNER